MIWVDFSAKHLRGKQKRCKKSRNPHTPPPLQNNKYFFFILEMKTTVINIIKFLFRVVVHFEHSGNKNAV